MMSLLNRWPTRLGTLTLVLKSRTRFFTCSVNATTCRSASTDTAAEACNVATLASQGVNCGTAGVKRLGLAVKPIQQDKQLDLPAGMRSASRVAAKVVPRF